MPKPLVAIVGRPNVGKSTLFNRLVGRQAAIVSEVAGTTRDRVVAETDWGDRPFIVVDTGGIDPLAGSEGQDLGHEVWAQIEVAVAEADVIILLVDVSVGVTAPDRDAAQMIRATGKPVLVAANKADNEQREADAVEFYELGLDDPLPISAYHNIGVSDLVAEVIARLPPESEAVEPEADLRLAIVGRTNVGKSLLLNAITGEERAIVSDIPGTTRDSLDSVIAHDGATIHLVDTAGIRRSGRIKPGIERYSVLRAVRAIDRADVAVLVLDASELTTAQDTHVASFILDASKGIVLAINKWDLSGELGLDENEATNIVRRRFKFAPYAPTCFISALRGTGLDTLLNTAREVQEEWGKQLPRYGLRRTVMNAVAEHPPSASGRRSLKIYSVAQDRTAPPTFTFYVNRSDMVHFSYQRYLENAIREAHGFKGCPLRMRFKGRGEK